MRVVWKQERCERKHTEHCVCLKALKKVLLEQKECWIVLGHSHSQEKGFRESQRGCANQVFSRVSGLSTWLKMVHGARGKTLWPDALMHCWASKIWKERWRKEGWKERQIICLLYERGKTCGIFSGVCWMRCHLQGSGWFTCPVSCGPWEVTAMGHWCSICCSHPTQEAEFSFPILICASADSRICPGRSCSYKNYVTFLKLLPPLIA